ncbi:integrase [Salirhabdus euzebyi]|uniref:Integrase n=2 Tax=Salirhabdus euzebyi TaxID=394506 RepID=A0A841Q2L4_9BACI|nr:integrase [Salirhabdus euzebyi]
MEKTSYADHVFLTEGQYLNLLDKYGEYELKRKMNELNSSKIKNPKRKETIKSDYHALISKGMQTVQPIRDRFQIHAMKEELKRDSFRNYFLFVMGINTGLRISDLLPLKVSDVRDKTHIVLKETKTRKRKRFLINVELRKIIAGYIEGKREEEFLFPSHKTDLPLQRVQAYKILNKAAKNVGITEFGTHSLRKTFGFWHYSINKNVALLQDIFNHTSPDITLRYIGINQDIVDQSLEHFSL